MAATTLSPGSGIKGISSPIYRSESGFGQLIPGCQLRNQETWSLSGVRSSSVLASGSDTEDVIGRVGEEQGAGAAGDKLGWA